MFISSLFFVPVRLIWHFLRHPYHFEEEVVRLKQGQGVHVPWIIRLLPGVIIWQALISLLGSVILLPFATQYGYLPKGITSPLFWHTTLMVNLLVLITGSILCFMTVKRGLSFILAVSITWAATWSFGFRDDLTYIGWSWLVLLPLLTGLFSGLSYTQFDRTSPLLANLNRKKTPSGIKAVRVTYLILIESIYFWLIWTVGLIMLYEIEPNRVKNFTWLIFYQAAVEGFQELGLILLFTFIFLPFAYLGLSLIYLIGRTAGRFINKQVNKSEMARLASHPMPSRA